VIILVEVIFYFENKYYGDWGLGIWGLGIGDWAQSPIPNPQSPIPNPHICLILKIFDIFKIDEFK